MRLVRTDVEAYIEENLCKAQGHAGAVIGTPSGVVFVCTRCGKTLEFETVAPTATEQGPRTPSMGLVTPSA